MSSKFQLRQQIRASLLANLEAYKLVDEVSVFINDAISPFGEHQIEAGLRNELTYCCAYFCTHS